MRRIHCFVIKNTLTNIYSIGNILIVNVHGRSLKSFCTKVGIIGQRKKAKGDVCKAIVDAKNYSIFVQLKDWQPTVPVKDENNTVSTSLVIIISRRLLDFIFADVVHTHLATLGATLSRDDLDIGKCQDKKFHELLAMEYNKIGVKAYDENSFPELSSGRTFAPFKFVPVDCNKIR